MSWSRHVIVDPCGRTVTTQSLRKCSDLRRELRTYGIPHSSAPIGHQLQDRTISLPTDEGLTYVLLRVYGEVLDPSSLCVRPPVRNQYPPSLVRALQTQSHNTLPPLQAPLPSAPLARGDAGCQCAPPPRCTNDEHVRELAALFAEQNHSIFRGRGGRSRSARRRRSRR